MASTASAVRGGQVTTGSTANTRGGGRGGGKSGSAGTAKLSKRGSKQDVVITGKLTPSSTSRTAVQGGSGRKRMKINSAFWGRLKRLLRILFPRFFSKPVLLLSLHSTYLVARTLVRCSRSVVFITPSLCLTLRCSVSVVTGFHLRRTA